MDSSVALQPHMDFSLKLKEEQGKVQESLKDKFNNAKLEGIKKILEEKNISYDEKCNDIKELKKNLKDTLDEVTYNETINILEDVEESYDKLIEDLQQGCTDGFQKFLNNIGKVSKTIASTTQNTLAARSAVALAPTIGSKLAVSSVAAVGSSIKLNKSKKRGVVIDQIYVCNKTLQELEVSRDEKGRVIDTRFKPNIQEIIREYLNNNNINFKDTGYLSLRQAIYDLDLDHKKELCNIVNNNMGNKIDFSERIDKTEWNLIDSGKKKLETIAKSTAVAVGGATAINSVDPAIMSTPLNGTLIGSIVNKLSNSKILTAITGFAGGSLSAILEHVPILGSVVKNANAIENLVVAGVAGAGLGLVSTAVASIVKTIKKTYDKFSTQRDRKKILKLDSQRYKEDNNQELSKMKEELAKESQSFEERILVDFISGYANDNGIVLKSNIKNNYELIKEINKLKPSDKFKMGKLFSKLERYNANENSFIAGLSKAKDIVVTLSSLGLAGLSVYDIIKNGEFLPELSAKLFKDVPDNIYLKIPNKIEFEKVAKDGSEYNEQLKNMIENQDTAMNHYNKMLEMKKIEVYNNAKPLNEIWNNEDKTFWQKCTDTVKSFKDSLNFHHKKLKSKVKVEDAINEIQEDEVAKKGIHWGDFENSTIISETPDKFTVETVDTTTMKKYVDSLSPEELVDLAYYYNMNRSHDHTHRVIGDVLNLHINEIRKTIEEYNKKMERTFKASDVIKKTTEGIVGATSAFDDEMFDFDTKNYNSVQEESKKLEDTKKKPTKSTTGATSEFNDEMFNFNKENSKSVQEESKESTFKTK